MKRILFSLLFLLLALGAHAQELVTATVTVVDIPNDGDSIVVNGNTRMWTNSPINGVSWISRTNTLEATTTNLYLHVAATPFVALNLGYSSSTAITLKGSVVAVSFAGTWATVAYATQAVTTMIAVRVPVAGLPQATNRTFVGSELLAAIADYATNSFAVNAPVLTNYLSLGVQPQDVLGPKFFYSISGTNSGLTNGTIVGATISESTYAGTVLALTNGVFETPILVGPTFTNGINFGNPFSSPGPENESQQFGTSAEAFGANSTAVGDAAIAHALGSTAFGSQATVGTNAPSGIALGFKSDAQGGSAIAIGTFSSAANTNSMALGVNALAIHDFSWALGNDTSTTTNNQIRVGNSSHTLSVPGDGGFGQRIAVGSDNFLSWPGGMNRGLILANGAFVSEITTNSVAIFSVSSQPFYRTGTMTEGAEANNRLHNRGWHVTGTGTDYSLTAATTRIDFSGQDPEIELPTAGTYLVTAVVEILNGATANDEYRLKLVNSTDLADIINSERATSSMAAGAIGQVVLHNIIVVDDSKLITLWGHNATAARGTIESERTSLTYVRLY